VRFETGAALPVWMKAGWAAGDVGIACYVGGTMAFLLFYATQAHGISPAWAGLALLIPRMIDVVLDPVMGAISDRTNSPMGRRRPYLLFGSIAFGVSFYLTFAAPDLASPTQTVLYIAGAYLLASAAFTVYSIPHAAMVAEMTTSYRERTSIVGYRMLGSRLGILLVGLAGPYLFSSQPTLKEGFRLFGLVFAAVIFSGGLISFFATRNAPRIEVSTVRFEFVREFQALLRNRAFVALFGVLLLQNMAIGMSATTLVYFLTIVMQVQVKYVGWFSAGAASVAMLVTPLWMRAGKHWGLGKRRMYSTAILIEIVAYGGIFLLVGANSVALFVALFVLMGVGDAACQLAPHSMAPDTVEAGELQSGLRSDGMIFGAISGCLKLGMAIGAFLVSVTLSYSGFVSGEAVATQAASAITGVRIAYCLIPVGLWLVALWLLRHYELDEARHDGIRAQLAARSR
jgi:glycoside/pentoside/hexuronide:cation symporter, GPH family